MEMRIPLSVVFKLRSVTLHLSSMLLIWSSRCPVFFLVFNTPFVSKLQSQKSTQKHEEPTPFPAIEPSCSHSVTIYPFLFHVPPPLLSHFKRLL